MDPWALNEAASAEAGQLACERVLQELPDGLLLVGPEGRIELVNVAAERLLGWSAARLVGRHVCEVLPEDVTTTLFQPRGGAPGRHAGAPVAAIRIPRRGGDHVLVEVSVAEIHDGDRVRHLATLRDVGARRAHDERSHRQRRMQTMGRLAGGMAHELNNHLMVVMGNAELAQMRLASDMAKGNPEKLERLLGEVLKGAKKSAEYLQRFLALGRRGTHEPRLVELGAWLEDAATRLRGEIPEGVVMVLAAEEGVGSAWVDPQRLEGVLRKLVTNAVEAIPGHGTLELAASAVEIPPGDLTSDLPPGRYLALDVVDSGMGMDAEVQARLFEPYFTTKSGKGRGLSLAEVWGFVEQAGGGLWVRSEPGEGTTFRMLLPREDARTRVHPAVGIGASGRPEHGGPVLVVDDDPAVRALVVEALEAMGHEVVATSGASEALEAIEAMDEGPSLLLTDLVLAREDGAALSREVRERFPDVPVVLMSGYAEGLVEKRGAAHEAFLAKPFTVDVLRRAVERALARPRPVLVGG